MRLLSLYPRLRAIPTPPPVVPRWTADDDADARLAASELEGRLARTVARLERAAAELEARHVRYGWTEALAQDLRAIAHDTPPVGG